MKALHAFEAAARHGSFSAAAAELSLTPGAIGYQVRQLETSLSVKLFDRRTRQVMLTAKGERLYHTAHRLFRELDDEIQRISPQQNPNLLTIGVTTYFVTRWLSQRLGHFMNEQPEITLRLQHSVNDPDFAVEEVDLAIRWGDGQWPGSDSELLVRLPMIAVCSPRLLEGELAIRQPRDILGHTLLHDQAGTDRWCEWFRQAGLDPEQAVDGPVIADPNVRVQSAIDGHGLVLVSSPLVQGEMQAGVLVEAFDNKLENLGYYLVFNQRAQQNRSFVLFRQWLRAQMDTWIEELDNTE